MRVENGVVVLAASAKAREGWDAAFARMAAEGDDVCSIPRPRSMPSTMTSGLVSPVHRYDVHLIDLDPTRGSEIRKTRPCVIISPDEMNRHIRTRHHCPHDLDRPRLSEPGRAHVPGTRGQIALDQIRAVDKSASPNASAASGATARVVASRLQAPFRLRLSGGRPFVSRPRARGGDCRSRNGAAHPRAPRRGRWRARTRRGAGSHEHQVRRQHPAGLHPT